MNTLKLNSSILQKLKRVDLPKILDVPNSKRVRGDASVNLFVLRRRLGYLFKRILKDQKALDTFDRQEYEALKWGLKIIRQHIRRSVSMRKPE